MNIRKLSMATLVLATGLSGAAQAALFDRGGGLIYDDALKVTWLADANYAQTSGYDADGRMNWYDATAWAANLVYHDSVRNVDYSDWRLPSVGNPNIGTYSPCTGGFCSSSELGFLFFGELARYANSNLYPFVNIQPDAYWFGDPSYSGNYYSAYYFHTYLGIQYPQIKSYEFYAWAVRDGDVAAIPVPEADTWAMLLAGLGLVGTAARRKKQFAQSKHP